MSSVIQQTSVELSICCVRAARTRHMSIISHPRFDVTYGMNEV
jgi:hypothetical protein